MTNKYIDAEVTRYLAHISHTHAEDWFLVFRARDGMETVFSTLGVGDIITQAYTCVTAINPILAAGLRPVYAEVSADTLAIDPDKLAVTSHTKGVVVQHTFGIIDNRETARIADQRGSALLIEDSAHCLGRFAHNEAGQKLADISIHSFGAEKLLPTKYGGAIWVNPHMADQQRRRRITAALTALPTPDRRTDFAARAYRNELRAITHLPSVLSRPLKNVLTKTGLFLPPITDDEQHGRQPDPQAPSPFVSKHMLSALTGYDDNLATRRHATSIYLQQLSGRVDIPASINATDPLVRFPIFIPRHIVDSGHGPEELFAVLKRRGYYPGRWYRPALFPGVNDDDLYNFDHNMRDIPLTADLIERAINLPTLESARRATDIAKVVKAWLDSVN